MYVVKVIEKNVGKKAEVELLPMQPGDIRESFADIDKSKKMLGFKPTVNIDEGIKNFIEWYNQYNK